MATASVGKIGVKIFASAEGMRAGINSAIGQLDRLEKATDRIRKSTRNLFVLQGLTAASRVFSSISTSLANIGRSMLRQSLQASQLYDAYAKLGRRVGQTGQEIAGLAYAGELSGVGLEQMTLAISTLERRFGDASAGVGTYKAAFAQLGLSMEDLAGKTSSERFQAVAEAISRMASPAQQLAVSGKLFEEAGVKLVPLFQQGAKGIREMVSQADRLGITLQGVDYSAFEAMNDAISTLRKQFTAVYAYIAAEISPLVQDLAGTFSELFNPQNAKAFATQVAGALESAAEILIDVADYFVLQLAPLVNISGQQQAEAAEKFTGFINITRNILTGIYGVANTIFGVFLKIVNIPVQLAASIAEMLDAIVPSFLRRGTGLSDAARDYREVANAFDSVAESYKQAGRDSYQYLLEGGAGAGQAAAGPIRKAFDEFRRNKNNTVTVDSAPLDKDRAAREKLHAAATRQQASLADAIEKSTSKSAFFDFNTVLAGRSFTHSGEAKSMLVWLRSSSGSSRRFQPTPQRVTFLTPPSLCRFSDVCRLDT